MEGINNIYALLVGINHYEEGLRDLEFSVQDVHAVRELCRDRMGLQDNLTFMLTSETGDCPTRSRFLATLAQLGSAPMRPTDLFLLYFAGHGFNVKGERYLMTEDTVVYPNDAEKNMGGSDTGLAIETAVSWPLFMQRVRQIKAGHQLLIVDACRNEPFASSRSLEVADLSSHLDEDMGRLARDVVGSQPRDEALPPRRAIVSACHDRQFSYEYPKGGHSWFCHHFLESVRSVNEPELDLAKVVGRVEAQMAEQAWRELPQARGQRPLLKLDNPQRPFVVPRRHSKRSVKQETKEKLRKRPKSQYTARFSEIVSICQGGKTDQGKTEKLVKLDSKPSGEKIWVDGQYVGNTPVIVHLDMGPHKIRMKGTEKSSDLGPKRMWWGCSKWFLVTNELKQEYSCGRIGPGLVKERQRGMNDMPAFNRKDSFGLKKLDDLMSRRWIEERQNASFESKAKEDTFAKRFMKLKQIPQLLSMALSEGGDHQQLCAAEIINDESTEVMGPFSKMDAAIISGLESRNDLVRANIADAIASERVKLGSHTKKVFSTLRSILNAGESGLVWIALKAVEKEYSERLTELLPDLTALLDSPYEQVLVETERTIATIIKDSGKIEVKEVGKIVEKITKLLNPADTTEVTRIGIEILGICGQYAQKSLPVVIDCMDGDNDDIRKAVVSALPRISSNDGGVARLLRQALNDSNRSVRRQAAKALGQMECDIDANVRVLIMAADDKSKDVAEDALVSIGKLGPWAESNLEQLLEHLKNIAEGDNKTLAKRAKDALDIIGDS